MFTWQKNKIYSHSFCQFHVEKKIIIFHCHVTILSHSISRHDIQFHCTSIYALNCLYAHLIIFCSFPLIQSSIIIIKNTDFSLLFTAINYSSFTVNYVLLIIHEIRSFILIMTLRMLQEANKMRKKKMKIIVVNNDNLLMFINALKT